MTRLCTPLVASSTAGDEKRPPISEGKAGRSFWDRADLVDEKSFPVPGQLPCALVELRVRAVMDNVPVVTRRVSEVASALGFEGQALYEIELAVDEACANVVEHAYLGEEQGEMAVSCYLQGQMFAIRVCDWGTGFDPNAVETPDVEAPLEERGLGGLGLFIVQRVMDEVTFSFDPGCGSKLLMSKRLPIAE
jgi:anti-sigma regulatory factor (Ser/Thr protein kinase)